MQACKGSVIAETKANACRRTSLQAYSHHVDFGFLTLVEYEAVCSSWSLLNYC